jgi:succinoglycan biosynthesis protein ExoM
MTLTSPAREAAASADPVRITVAVPTYKRPVELRAVLPLVLAQIRAMAGESDGGFVADLLVVDNDPEGSGAAVVAEFAAPDVRCVAEPTPGIAAVRNRAIEEAAGARLLAFIDDDERPMAAWLSALVDTWERSGAAAVSGRIVPAYAGEPGPWIRAGGFFVRRSLPTGTDIAVAATGNILLDLDQVRRHGVRFDSALGLGGGEDTLFSRTLARAGGRLVWCNESVAIDHVPPERMTRRWVLTRAYSHGNAAVLTELRLTAHRSGRLQLRLRWVGRGLVRIAGGGARWGWGVLRGSLQHQARGLRAACRGAGMVGAGCGVVYQEYARSGRRWRPSRGGAR